MFALANIIFSFRNMLVKKVLVVKLLCLKLFYFYLLIGILFKAYLVKFMHVTGIQYLSRKIRTLYTELHIEILQSILITAYRKSLKSRPSTHNCSKTRISRIVCSRVDILCNSHFSLHQKCLWRLFIRTTINKTIIFLVCCYIFKGKSNGIYPEIYCLKVVVPIKYKNNRQWHTEYIKTYCVLQRTVITMI